MVLITLDLCKFEYNNLLLEYTPFKYVSRFSTHFLAKNQGSRFISWTCRELSFGVSFKVFVFGFEAGRSDLALKRFKRLRKAIECFLYFCLNLGRSSWSSMLRTCLHKESEPWNVTMFSKLRHFPFGFLDIVAKHKQFGKP
jgi:hypothetical protein